MISVGTSISDVNTRQHVTQLLTEVAPLEGLSVVEVGCQQTCLTEWLKKYYATSTPDPLILISDFFTNKDVLNGTRTLATEYLEIFGERAFATIAITCQGGRLTDIDRLMPPDIGSAELRAILKRVVDRIYYLAPPTPAIKVEPDSLSLRLVRMDNVTELVSYFRLRHKVYTLMGYLDEDVENSSSRLEINEADTHSIHLAAFRRTGGQELLIGTTRVVTNEQPNHLVRDALLRLTNGDLTAKARLHDVYPLGLPIFQSHKGMDSIIRDIYFQRPLQRCGEVSRVIVHPDFRGNGIAHRLMKEAILRSRQRGTQRLFLECLKIHEHLYNEHGFVRLPDIEGPVVDVYRTMIAMELAPIPEM